MQRACKATRRTPNKMPKKWTRHRPTAPYATRTKIFMGRTRTTTTTTTTTLVAIPSRQH